LAPVASLGALAQSTLGGNSTLGLAEVGLLVASRLVDLCRGERRVPASPSGRDRRRAIDAALWIEAHAEAKVNLGDAAAIASLSTFHFLRIFSAVVGATPHQFLLTCRLRRSVMALCETDLPITNVAHDAGFDDLSNFIRTFRRALGVSPRELRRSCRQDRNFLQEQLTPHALT
jgi:AraC-like DNA-binding protein